MFEKEAKEYGKENCVIQNNGLCTFVDSERTSKIWQDGAEFGYNKANEWHYIKSEADLPKDNSEYLLLLDHGIRVFGYYNGKFWESWKGDLAWQEVKAYYDVPVPN